MNMKRILLVVIVATIVCPGPLDAASVSYIGKLAYGGGGADGNLSVNSIGPDRGWLYQITSIAWQIDSTDTPGIWHYQYKITVPNGGDLSTDIQCMIVETSPTFSWDSIMLDTLTSTPADWLVKTEIDSFSPWANQKLPSSVYGIMFRTVAVDPKTLTIGFSSNRAPVWGDVYVRSFVLDGKYNTFHNEGWERFMDDNDPTDPPDDRCRP